VPVGMRAGLEGHGRAADAGGRFALEAARHHRLAGEMLGRSSAGLSPASVTCTPCCAMIGSAQPVAAMATVHRPARITSP
jgi:hypothetical protein